MSLLLESWCWTTDWEIWLYKYMKEVRHGGHVVTQSEEIP